MRNKIERGETLEFIAEKDVESGEPVVIGDKMVVALDAAKKGTNCVSHATGVFRLVKPEGVEIPQGKKVKLGDDGNMTPLEGVETAAHGVCWKRAEAADKTVDVKLL